MLRRPPRSTLSSSSAASDVYKRQLPRRARIGRAGLYLKDGGAALPVRDHPVQVCEHPGVLGVTKNGVTPAHSEARAARELPGDHVFQHVAPVEGLGGLLVRYRISLLEVDREPGGERRDPGDGGGVATADALPANLEPLLPREVVGLCGNEGAHRSPSSSPRRFSMNSSSPETGMRSSRSM